MQYKNDIIFRKTIFNENVWKLQANPIEIIAHMCENGVVKIEKYQQFQE